jgi:hypothetical protein
MRAGWPRTARRGNEEIGKAGDKMAKTETARVEMWRVRRANDGFYLFKDFTVVKNTVYLRWHVTMAGEWPRAQAAHIADAMIALTGDYGIEIEPVEG